MFFNKQNTKLAFEGGAAVLKLRRRIGLRFAFLGGWVLPMLLRSSVRTAAYPGLLRAKNGPPRFAHYQLAMDTRK